MIDWKLAGTIAEAVAALGPVADGSPFERPGTFADESERLVVGYTGLTPAAPLPRAEAVSRTAWIDANLRSLRTVLDPVAERVSGSVSGPLGGAMGAGAGVVLAVEAGALSGFLAQRVLGQYEFPVLDPAAGARLLFVAPNLATAAGSLEADPQELLRWVALHETTHAVQFGAVPWLRGHLAEMVGELLATVEVDPRSLMRLPDLSDLRGLVESVREGGIAALALGPERRVIMERAQAFMAVLEGYAEHVMDAVGADVLTSLPHLRERLDRRRRERTGLLRLVEKLLGFDLKLRQYEQGKAFCDGVVERAGIAGLNHVWNAPASMPSLAELDDPAAWLARVTPRAA